LSPYRKGFVPTTDIVHWFETWSKKISPDKINLLGGEPFLHPDLATVVLESRRIWSNSTLEVVSNGLLISQASQPIFDALKKAEIHVVISDHSGADLPREKVLAACTRLDEKGISYTLRPSNSAWRVQYQLSAEEVLVPFQSCSRDAWSICIGRMCIALANNRLYKCAILASVIEGVREGSLSPSLWNEALTYNPLKPNADAAAILEHLRSKEIKECCICSDKIVITEARQMPRVA